MPNANSNIDLKETFKLIEKIKQGIKQECYVEISNIDLGASDRALRIRIQAKNYKTNVYMYIEKVIAEKEIIFMNNYLYNNLIDMFIEKANYYFRKEQSKIYNCEECGKHLSNEEIKEGITICEECATSLYAYMMYQESKKEQNEI